LTEAEGIAPEQVLLYGRSLGSAVAIELASREPHRALVLVSPFTSLPDVALSYFPLLPARQLMRNQFDSWARIGRCSRPVLFVHGTRDRLVPFTQGRRLFAAANGPKQFLAVEGAGHGNCVGPSFFTALRNFLLGLPAAGDEAGLFKAHHLLIGHAIPSTQRPRNSGKKWGSGHVDRVSRQVVTVPWQPPHPVRRIFRRATWTMRLVQPSRPAPTGEAATRCDDAFDLVGQRLAGPFALRLAVAPSPSFPSSA
jgi:hypothetical protein